PVLPCMTFASAELHRKVVIVSQSFADRFWPGTDPVGQVCITRWAGDQPAEVIGVVGDIRTVQLDEPPLMMVYVPYWFNAISVPSSAPFVFRTATEPAASVGGVRRLTH